jgi:hypothetical protein
MPEIDRRRLAATMAAGVASIPVMLSARIAAAAEPSPSDPDGVLVSVKDSRFGAKGDGVEDDTAAIQAAIDFCFGPPGSPHGRQAHRNRPLYFPPGVFKISAPLSLSRIRGAHIFGPGRFTATIIQKTANQPVFATNGFEYSRVEGLYLEAAGDTAPIFDLNWDGKPPVALQEVLFKDVYFKGGGIGVDIGRGKRMGSENLFLGCFFEACAIAGLKTSNFNALQNTVIGGNFQGCGRAIWVRSGSVPTIVGVGFQRAGDFDFRMDNSARDTVQLIGCRTESPNFVHVSSNPVHTTLLGCSQLATEDGVFIDAGDSPATIIGSVSVRGIVRARAPRLVLQHCQFERAEWHDFTRFAETSFVDIQNVHFGSPDRKVPEDKFIARRRIVASGTYDGNAPIYREATEAAVEIAPADEIVGINNKLGVPVTVKLGPAEARNGVPITIKDISGTAATSNITLEFSGDELCDGMPASQFAIARAYGSAVFYPRAGGWYRLN